MKKILLLFLILITGCTNSFHIKLDVEGTKKLLSENSDILIIDVRTKEEYDLGHIEGAILIPYDVIEYRIEELSEYKDKPILVYCRTSNRSSIAASILKENGFTQIYQMTDGYSNWE
jgi:rhodanese-related sulfurtransferase